MWYDAKEKIDLNDSFQTEIASAALMLIQAFIYIYYLSLSASSSQFFA